MNRRRLLQYIAASALVAALPRGLRAESDDKIGDINLSDAQWRQKLTPAQYNILRQEGTEPPFTSPLLDEHRTGAFVCAGCQLPLFLSQAKFDSGTGWPSFFDAIPGHLGTKTDYKVGVARTEYHCARCGGHHGHVFDDGPAPTGLRYCSNGAALVFIAKGEKQ